MARKKKTIEQTSDVEVSPSQENPATEDQQNEIQLTRLTTAQEIGALRTAHQFFSDFDRVPGGFASKWGQMLDAIAIVANSLIAKGEDEAKQTAEENNNIQ